MTRLAYAAAIFAGLSLSVGAGTGARADIFNLTVDGCSSGCGLTNYGTVEVTPISGGFHVDVELASGVLFHQSQGSEPSPGLYFNLAGTGITFDNIVFDAGLFTFTAGAFNDNLDGFGVGNFALLCASDVPGNTCGDSLEFDVTGTGLAFNALVGGSRGLINFVADILNQGATGPVGSPVPGPIVGAGLPGLIFACGSLLALARRRRLQRVA
jgi:hypothetical protein